jgi:hypothetical protein
MNLRGGIAGCLLDSPAAAEVCRAAAAAPHRRGGHQHDGGAAAHARQDQRPAAAARARPRRARLHRAPPLALLMFQRRRANVYVSCRLPLLSASLCTLASFDADQCARERVLAHDQQSSCAVFDVLERCRCRRRPAAGRPCTSLSHLPRSRALLPLPCSSLQRSKPSRALSRDTITVHEGVSGFRY